MSQIQPITKTILAQKYGLSYSTIKRYLNCMFYAELAEVGYRKNMRILPPAVVKRFIEIYGSPDDNLL